MKRIILPLFALTITLTAISIILTSSSQGRAFAANSGNTGAPGETLVCGNCHGGGSFGNTSYQIELLDSNNNAVNSYIPGSVYTLRGTFTTPTGSTNPSAYGFQVVSLLATNSSNYNAWSSPSSNVRIASSSSNSRSYAEHNGPSSSPIYTVSWTAPPVGSGSVDFYSASNGVNLNRGTSGDNGYTDQLTITENVSTNLLTSEKLNRVNTFPNPVSDLLYVDPAGFNQLTLMLFDLKGALIQTLNISSNQVSNLDLSNLSSGIYLLRIEDQQGNGINKKLVKQ